MRAENLALTKKLLAISHQHFIFISTVDVYPRNETLHNEEELIQEGQVIGAYAQSKMDCEVAVKSHSKNALILRATALLGPYAKPNSLIRIMREDNCKLTLSADSVFNYILYEDVLSFIRTAVERNLSGIYNMASSKNITLADSAKLLKKQPQFGDYCYQVGHVDNRKVSSVLPAFKKTSEEVIKQFAKN